MPHTKEQLQEEGFTSPELTKLELLYLFMKEQLSRKDLNIPNDDLVREQALLQTSILAGERNVHRIFAGVFKRLGERVSGEKEQRLLKHLDHMVKHFSIYSVYDDWVGLEEPSFERGDLGLTLDESLSEKYKSHPENGESMYKRNYYFSPKIPLNTKMVMVAVKHLAAFYADKARTMTIEHKTALQQFTSLISASMDEISILHDVLKPNKREALYQVAQSVYQFFLSPRTEHLTQLEHRVQLLKGDRKTKSTLTALGKLLVVYPTVLVSTFGFGFLLTDEALYTQHRYYTQNGTTKFFSGKSHLKVCLAKLSALHKADTESMEEMVKDIFDKETLPVDEVPSAGFGS